MSDMPRGPGWWLASDQRWYPPHLLPVAPPKQASPRAPRTKLVGLLAAVVWAAVLAVILLLVFGSSDTASGLSGKAASQVLAVTLAAARSEGSVHVAATGPSETYDIGLNEGTQTISGGTEGNATLVVVPDRAYVKGDAAFLENDLGLSSSVASLYAGKWISFDPTDPDYQAVIDGDTVGSTLSESTPQGQLTLSSARTFEGQNVVEVSGGLGEALTKQGVTGSDVLYVSTSAPYLPVAFIQSTSLNGQSNTLKLTFSSWGEKVSVRAPTGATPFSSIPT
jgi:hypothetical protein